MNKLPFIPLWMLNKDGNLEYKNSGYTISSPTRNMHTIIDNGRVTGLWFSKLDTAQDWVEEVVGCGPN